MSKICYRVNFENSRGLRSSKDFEFNDENHFNNWHKKQLKDESYRKIIGFERVIKKTTFDINQIMRAFNAGRNTEISMQEWIEKTFNI